MKTALASVLLIALTACVSPSQESKVDKKILEPPRFWTALANDAKLPKWQRGVAVYLLFDRHVRTGMDLRELGEILRKPTWIKENDVSEVVAVVGSIPLKRQPGVRIFRVLVFHNPNFELHDSERFAIYLGVSGEIDKKGLVSTIRGEKTEVEKCKLTAWAFSPTWAEFLEEIPKR